MSILLPLAVPPRQSSRHLPSILTVPDDSTAQVNDADPVMPVASVAYTRTASYPRALGVPEMTPPGLTDRPAGSPLAVYRSGSAEPESRAAMASGVTCTPARLSRAPGLVTTTELSTAWNAPVPSGVPQPAGPSYPARAVHR